MLKKLGQGLNVIYNGNSVCPSVWAVPGKFWTGQKKEKNVTSS
jgi:hypothetical protein